MTLDLTPEEENVLARLKTLCGGRVFEFIPDDKILERDPSGVVKPYITVDFGEPFPNFTAGQSVAGGPEDRPHTWVVSTTAWGATAAHTGPIGKAIRLLMIGWSPNPDNTYPFDARGGGSFSGRDSASRPAKSARLLTFVADTNLSS